MDKVMELVGRVCYQRGLPNYFYRGFSGVHQIFVKPEVGLNPSPVNIIFSESWNKITTFLCEHQIP